MRIGPDGGEDICALIVGVWVGWRGRLSVYRRNNTHAKGHTNCGGLWRWVQDKINARCIRPVASCGDTMTCLRALDHTYMPPLYNT